MSKQIKVDNKNFLTSVYELYKDRTKDLDFSSIDANGRKWLNSLQKTDIKIQNFKSPDNKYPLNIQDETFQDLCNFLLYLILNWQIFYLIMP